MTERTLINILESAYFQHSKENMQTIDVDSHAANPDSTVRKTNSVRKKHDEYRRIFDVKIDISALRGGLCPSSEHSAQLAA
jgi:hypothetical protein